MNRGHCTNLPSRCSKAKSQELVQVTGPRTACPECGKPVKPVTATGRKSWVVYVILALVIAAGLALALLFRNEKPKEDSPSTSETSSNAEIDCAKVPALSLNGSDVLANMLTPDLVEGWMHSRAVENIRRSQEQGVTTISGERASSRCLVRITGPNTSDGLAALGQGTTDIAMSPRQLNEAEVSALGQLGDMRSPAAEHVVAIDALSVIVNQASAIRQLSRGELADILFRRITNWSSLQGNPRDIHLIITEDSSRASDTATELLGPIAGSAQRPSSDAGVVEAVSRDPEAIGIVSFPAGKSVRTLAIGERGATAFAPSADTIATQTYPLTRRLYYYASPRPSNPNTKDFLSFVRSNAGQSVVTRAGYGGQNVQVVASSSVREDASEGYRSLVGKARQLNVAFRFRTGQSVLDNKALDDLNRLVTFLPPQTLHDKSPLILIGFADTQGETSKNLDLSKQRAEAVATALSSKQIRPQLVRWFGEEQPVGDNATVSGRERNRRVEVWTTR